METDGNTGPTCTEPKSEIIKRSHGVSEQLMGLRFRNHDVSLSSGRPEDVQLTPSWLGSTPSFLLVPRSGLFQPAERKRRLCAKEVYQLVQVLRDPSSSRVESSTGNRMQHFLTRKNVQAGGFNVVRTRISNMDADVGHIVHCLKRLHCSEITFSPVTDEVICTDYLFHRDTR